MLSSGKQVEDRMKVCNVCEYKILQLNINKCGKCGCFLAAKTKYIHSKCPIGKW